MINSKVLLLTKNVMLSEHILQFKEKNTLCLVLSHNGSMVKEGVETFLSTFWRTCKVYYVGFGWLRMFSVFSSFVF